MKVLNLMYASSDLYAKITGVSILSLLEKNKHLETINFYILSYGITLDNKKKLERTINKFGRKIEFIDMKPFVELVSQMGVLSYKQSTMVYMKFFVSHYISPDIERIIHVDSDTLIMGKVDEWLLADLKNKPCAMVQDCIHKRYKRYIGMDTNLPYFNSGFVIFDLKRWNDLQCEAKILNHIKNVKSEYPLVDQDLFNIVLHDQICELNIKNNLLPTFLLYRYKDYKRIYGIGESILSEMEYKEGIKHTVMHQFSGNCFGRPWFQDSHHPVVEEYKACWRRSEWRDISFETKKIPFEYRVQYFFYRYAPKSVNAAVGYLMQRIFLAITYEYKNIIYKFVKM